MTGIQLEYLNYRENQRANLARERENFRHNVTTERETRTHNVATENYNVAALKEQARHNRVGELWTGFSAFETHRTNKARETETNRHNMVTELNDYRYWKTEDRKADSQIELWGAQKDQAEAMESKTSAEAKYQRYQNYVYSANLEDRLRSEWSYWKAYSYVAPVKAILDGVGLSNTGSVVSTVLKSIK